MWDLLSSAVVTVGELGWKGHVEFIIRDVTEATTRGWRVLKPAKQYTSSAMTLYSLIQMIRISTELYTLEGLTISLLSLLIRTTCGRRSRCLGSLHAYTEDWGWLLCLMLTGYTPPRCVGGRWTEQEREKGKRRTTGQETLIINWSMRSWCNNRKSRTNV